MTPEQRKAERAYLRLAYMAKGKYRKEYHQKYYLEHREQILAYQREYRIQRREEEKRKLSASLS